MCSQTKYILAFHHTYQRLRVRHLSFNVVLLNHLTWRRFVLLVMSSFNLDKYQEQTLKMVYSPCEEKHFSKNVSLLNKDTEKYCVRVGSFLLALAHTESMFFLPQKPQIYRISSFLIWVYDLRIRPSDIYSHICE